MRIAPLCISTVVLFTASPIVRGESYTVFGGEWILPSACEVHILGSLNWDVVQVFCTFNEQDIEKFDYVSIRFKKKDPASLELLKSAAKEETIVTESIGALSITTWQQDFVKSRHLLFPDADPEPDERLKSRKGFYRVICDEEVCIHMSATHLENIERLSRDNLESHNKSFKADAINGAA